MSDVDAADDASTDAIPAAAFIPWADFGAAAGLNAESSVARRNLIRQQWVREQAPAFVAEHAGDEPIGQSRASKDYREWKARRDYAEKYINARTKVDLPPAQVAPDKRITGLGFVDSAIAGVGDLASSYGQGVYQQLLAGQQARAVLSGNTDEAARIAQDSDKLSAGYKAGLSPDAIESQRKQDEKTAAVYAEAGITPGSSEKLSLWDQTRLAFGNLGTNYSNSTARSLGSNPVGTVGTGAQIVGAGLSAIPGGVAVGGPLIGVGKVASVAGGTVAGGLDTAKDAFDNVMKLDPATISASEYGPLYSKAYAAALSEAVDAGNSGREATLFAEGKARAVVAGEAFKSAGIVGGIVTGALEAVGAKIGQGAIAGKVGKTVALSTAKHAAVDALVVEAPQELLTKALSNNASINAGDDRGISRDLLDSYVQGAGQSFGTSVGTVGAKSIYNKVFNGTTPSPTDPAAPSAPGVPPTGSSDATGTIGSTDAPASRAKPAAEPVAPAPTAEPVAPAPTYQPTEDPESIGDDPIKPVAQPDTRPVVAPSDTGSTAAAPANTTQANAADGTAEAVGRPVVAPVDGTTTNEPGASVEAVASPTSPAAADITGRPANDLANGASPTTGTGASANPNSEPVVAGQSAASGKAVDGGATPTGTDGAGGSTRADVARSPGIPDRGAPSPLGAPDARPAAPSPEGRVAGVVGGADPTEAVGKYNPTETGIYPTDEAPQRALSSIVGPVTVKNATAEAEAHYNAYAEYAAGVNKWFGETGGAVIPRAQFITELTNNILAAAAGRLAPKDAPAAKRAAARAAAVAADPDAKSPDRRVRGDRREADGWLTPEARWQQTPTANVQRINDTIAAMPGWRGEALRSLVASGQLKVAPTFTGTLPAQYAGQLGRTGASFNQDKATIYADQTGTDVVFAKALHELGGHGGLQQLFPASAITALAGRITALSGRDPSAAYAASRASEGATEVVAHFAEDMARREARGEALSSNTLLGKLWEDLKAGITKGLQRVLNNRNIDKLSPKEIYELALGALASRAAPSPSTPDTIAVAQADVNQARAALDVVPLPPVSLTPLSEALAAISARGNQEEIALAERMALVGDPLLNGVVRQMALRPEKYQQYLNVDDVNGVEFSIDYRDSERPLNKPGKLERLQGFSDATREALFDPAARAVDWLRSTPASKAAQAAAVDALRTAPNVYRYMGDQFQKEYVAPILKSIQAIARESKQTVDEVVRDLGDVLTAIDVPRVNARLIADDVQRVQRGEITVAQAAQRLNATEAPDGANPPDTANGELGVAAGMSNLQAAGKIARFALKYPNAQAQVDAIQKLVYGMNARALVAAVEHGMHTPYAAALFSNPAAEPLLERLKQPNVTDTDRDAAAAAVLTTYVPMNSDAVTEQDQRNVGPGSSGRLGGAAIQRAEGRGSMPLDGLNSSLLSVDGVLRHVAYQPFKRELAKVWDAGLAANSNNPAATSKALGFSRERTGLRSLKGDLLYYREDGATSVFHWNDPAIGAAITGSNTNVGGTVVGDAMRAGLRTYSGLATVHNPLFPPLNALKDISEKILRIGSANVLDATGRPIRTTKDIFPAIRAIGVIPAATRATFKRFMGGGGATTVADLQLEELLAEGGSSLFGDSLRAAQGARNAVAEQAKEGYTAPGKLIEKISDYSHAWNAALENISALVAHMYFRDKNATPKAAAAGALELMNFGKRGTLVKPLSTFTPFVGPALIGAANLANDIYPRLVDKTDKSTGLVVQRRSFAGVATLASLAVGLTGVALAMSGGEDDDDPALGSKLLNGVPQTTLERSLPIKVGDSYVKSPVPFGAFMLAWGAAVEAARYIRGEISGADAIKAGLVENLVKHLTPFKPPQFKFQDAPLDYVALSAAGILAPIYTAATGATNFNSSRTVRQNDEKTAASQASITVPPVYVAVSEAFHSTLGLNFRPAVIKGLVDSYTPGVLGMARRTLIDNPHKEAQGKSTVNPLVSTLVMDAENPFAVMTKLNEYVKDAQRDSQNGTELPGDANWLRQVRSQNGVNQRARKGMTDLGNIKRLDDANEQAQRKLLIDYRRRHNIGMQ